jgi:hypothetical protein
LLGNAIAKHAIVLGFVLKCWGTKWQYALETFDFLKSCPVSFEVGCGELGVFRLGPNITWEAVEAVVLKVGMMPQKDWRDHKFPGVPGSTESPRKAG